jgi:hypothetical protein
MGEYLQVEIHTTVVLVHNRPNTGYSLTVPVYSVMRALINYVKEEVIRKAQEGDQGESREYVARGFRRGIIRRVPVGAQDIPSSSSLSAVLFFHLTTWIVKMDLIGSATKNLRGVL